MSPAKKTIKKRQMDSLCRTCLQKSEYMKSIFADNDEVCKMIKLCSGISINVQDGLSTNICSDCLTKVYAAYEFQKQCKMSHKILLKFKKNKIKYDSLNESHTQVKSTVKEYRGFYPGKLCETKLTDQSMIKVSEDDNTDLKPPVNVSIKQEPNDDIFSEDDNAPLSVYSNNISLVVPKIEIDANNFGNHEIFGCYNKEKHQCRQCEKSFSKYKDLRRHRATHTRAKQINCDQCDKTFCSLARKKSHMLIHLGIKPFQCDICLLFFRRKDILRSHVKKHHNEE